MKHKYNPEYALLTQNAIEYIEQLLDFWKIPWQKGSTSPEYNLLAVWRGDRHFGSCSFNINKNKGNDFARDNYIPESDYKMLGGNFTKEDYTVERGSFNLIGLVARVYELDPINDYHKAARLLREDLAAIGASFNKDELELRAQHRIKVQKEHAARQLGYAETLWRIGKDIKESPGEIYLNERGIFLEQLDEFAIDVAFLEPNMKFVRLCRDAPIPYGRLRPTIVFKISNKLDGELKAVHRIFLSNDHKTKADMPEPKKLLGEGISGNAIWFGEKDKDLYVAEGPEDALSLRFAFRFKHVISTISAGLMPHVPIPRYVKRLIVCVDPDDAGVKAGAQLAERASQCGVSVVVVAPPKLVMSNGKLADWNDLAKLGTQDKALLVKCRDYITSAVNSERSEGKRQRSQAVGAKISA